MREQVRFKLTRKTVCAACWIPDKIRESSCIISIVLTAMLIYCDVNTRFAVDHIHV